MLLWSERHNNIYFGAGFENGLIKIVNNLLKNNSILINTEPSYIDGAWHTLNIQLNKHFLKVIIDNIEQINENLLQSNEHISNGDRIFIGEYRKQIILTFRLQFLKFTYFPGGLSSELSTESKTNIQYRNAFHGCIDAVKLGNKMEYIHDFSVFEGENIGSCHYGF